MMKILGLIVLFLILILIDLRSLIGKQQDKGKYFWVYGLILITAFVLSVLQIIDMSPPTPSKGIEFVVKKIMGGS